MHCMFIRDCTHILSTSYTPAHLLETALQLETAPISGENSGLHTIEIQKCGQHSTISLYCEQSELCDLVQIRWNLLLELAGSGLKKTTAPTHTKSLSVLDTVSLWNAEPRGCEKQKEREYVLRLTCVLVDIVTRSIAIWSWCCQCNATNILLVLEHLYLHISTFIKGECAFVGLFVAMRGA